MEGEDARKLPGWLLKVNPRARRVTLRLTMDEGLCVVVPRGFDARRVPGIVAERAEWIARHMARMTARYGRTPGTPPPFPEVLELRACGESWTVKACPGPGRTRLRRGPGELLLAGEDDPAARRKLLLGFLRERATAHFPPLLRELAAEAGENLGAVAVRNQKTRWASCSSRGVVNCNTRLLFLPPHLVRHVLLHELAHLRRMDHSPAFWARLAELDPRWREHERELKLAGSLVPAFLA